MAKAVDVAAQSLAVSLRPLLSSSKRRVSLSEILTDVEGHDGWGPVLFVLALPVLLPLPPGVSRVMALPLLVVSAEIAIGRQSLCSLRRSPERPSNEPS